MGAQAAAVNFEFIIFLFLLLHMQLDAGHPGACGRSGAPLLLSVSVDCDKTVDIILSKDSPCQLHNSFGALGTARSTATFPCESPMSVFDETSNFDDCGLPSRPAAQKLRLGRDYKARLLMVPPTLGTGSCFSWATTGMI